MNGPTADGKENGSGTGIFHLRLRARTKKGMTMLKMPVLAGSGNCPAGSGERSARSRMIADRLPVFYMSDFSILGLLVDKLEEAVRLMEASNLRVMHDGPCVEVAVNGPDHLAGIVRFLVNEGIECQVSDLIDEVYQG